MKKASEESCDKKRYDNNFELPDETSMNNIDLGGILNLATEDTLNIRYLEFILDNTFFDSKKFQRIFLEHPLHLVITFENMCHYW